MFYETKRPDNSLLADGTWFKAATNSHSAAAGATPVTTSARNSPAAAPTICMPPTLRPAGRFGGLYRPFFASSVGVNQSLYLGDTFHSGRVTAQLSLRYDRSYASMLESAQAAIPGFPTLLPAIIAPAVDKMIDLSLFSPRARHQLRARRERAYAVRASYGLFGSQLGTGTVQSFSAASQAILIYSATDRNGNNVADPNELEALQNFAGVDPDPGAGVNFNRVSPDLKSPKTHEFVLGIDRELMPQFGVSASMTWRRFTDVIWSGRISRKIAVYPLVGVTRADYQLEGTVRATCAGLGAYSQDTSRRATSSLPPGNGGEYRNRPDYSQQYLGFEVQATKRLSNKWMARVGSRRNRHTEHFGGEPLCRIPEHRRPGRTSTAVRSSPARRAAARARST